MKTNTKVRAAPAVTYEGAPAARIDPERALLRAVMACMLWEDGFYESGQELAARIAGLVPLVSPEFAAATAAHARWGQKLRHAPLLVVREMCRHPLHKALVGRLLPDVIGRADEITEFLSLYWKTNGGKKSLPAQVKKGLSAAFRKFGEYELAKYDRDGAVRLRDAMFLSHARPDGADARYTRLERRQERSMGRVYDLGPSEELYRRLAQGELATPDTWEVALSGGADKKLAFERLMAEGKLGALAFLRNLRNMTEAGVGTGLMRQYAAHVKVDRVLPFRFMAAARYAPHMESALEEMMFRCLAGSERLAGHTVLMVDVSGSMDDQLSGKSEMRRVDAACGLAVLLREVSESVEVFTFSSALARVPDRRGFALRDAVLGSQPHGGTYLGRAVSEVLRTVPGFDRLVVITDEQSHDKVTAPAGKRAYMLNVAGNKNGIGYGDWVHVDGWSEAVVGWVAAFEKGDWR